MSNKRWFLIAVFAAVGLLGLFGAAGSETPAGQLMGVALTAAAAFLALSVVKQHFDGVPEGYMLDVLPHQPANNLRLIAVMGIVAVGGLFSAADTDPALQWFGIALFAAATFIAFGALKRYFDAIKQEPPGDSSSGGHGA